MVCLYSKRCFGLLGIERKGCIMKSINLKRKVALLSAIIMLIIIWGGCGLSIY